MFKNIGKKIKGLAALVCWLGIIFSALVAAGMWAAGYAGFAILILIIGALSSWISSFYAYALGTITENSDKQLVVLTKLYEEQKMLNEQLAQKASDNE